MYLTFTSFLLTRVSPLYSDRSHTTRRYSDAIITSWRLILRDLHFHDTCHCIRPTVSRPQSFSTLPPALLSASPEELDDTLTTRVSDDRSPLLSVTTAVLLHYAPWTPHHSLTAVFIARNLPGYANVVSPLVQRPQSSYTRYIDTLSFIDNCLHST